MHGDVTFVLQELAGATIHGKTDANPGSVSHAHVRHGVTG
jgi:hypothetical protein